jgi:hypothetical protein
VPFPVARDLQRIDRIHPIPGRDQCLYPRATIGLDPDQHLRLEVITVITVITGVAGVRDGVQVEELSDQRVQPGHPGHALVEPAPDQASSGGVHHLHVVMILGPVVPDKQHSPTSRIPCARVRSVAAGRHSAT